MLVELGVVEQRHQAVLEVLDGAEAIAAQGITRGCNPPVNDRFCPDSVVTRGQMAAFLTRALGLTDRLDDPFTDDDDSIFEADIEKLAAAGITRAVTRPSTTSSVPTARLRGAKWLRSWSVPSATRMTAAVTGSSMTMTRSLSTTSTGSVRQE